MRKPFVLANWKMAMTLEETRAFVEHFRVADEGRAADLDVVICPPATALAALAEVAGPANILVGAQDLSVEADPAHTGQLSARLLADAGARWVLIGHWEVRRAGGDDGPIMNRKVRRALEAGLRPILLLGPDRLDSCSRSKNLGSATSLVPALSGSGEQQHESSIEKQLRLQVREILKGCTTDEVATMAFVYEPAWAIGQAEPAPKEWIERGVTGLRRELADRFGEQTADRARIIYGGSVTPESAEALLSIPDLDGLGVGRKGREPQALAALVQWIHHSRSAGAMYDD